MVTSESQEIKKQETLVRFSIISYKTRLSVETVLIEESLNYDYLSNLLLILKENCRKTMFLSFFLKSQIAGVLKQSQQTLSRQLCTRNKFFYGIYNVQLFFSVTFCKGFILLNSYPA